jgi:hypothetical protein
MKETNDKLLESFTQKFYVVKDILRFFFFISFVIQRERQQRWTDIIRDGKRERKGEKFH